MAMAIIWTGMVLLALISAVMTGRVEDLSASVMEGATSAVSLSISLAGILCLWMGVMEVMKRAGLVDGLALVLKPILGRLFPEFRHDDKVMGVIAANVSANLLGLGNAATPLGLEAARLMSRLSPGVASNSLCMLVVCNTASIQLIPSTVAAVRASAGAENPFDILPAVWLASAMALFVGITMATVLSKVWGD